MKTKNIYRYPISLEKVTGIQNDSIAHTGDLVHSIDFDAPEGTDVFAALDGTVVEVKDDSNVGGDDPSFEQYGNYIAILHKNGEVSEYEHLLYRSAHVKVGDCVVAGQKIANVGNTGYSECPHLHFMVYPEDKKYTSLWRYDLIIRK